MGLFDFLFGSKSASNVEVVNDRIWMSQQAKSNGVLKELEDRTASGAVAILLIAHFPDTLDKLKAIAANYRGDVPVTTTLADSLSANTTARLNFDDTATIDLIVAERHPLLAVDDKVMELAKELPCRCRVVHHLSLEDPLLKSFAGAWVGGLLKNLGASEDEVIESKMVSRQIKAAQKKVAAKALGNAKADSAAEWMEKNMSNSSTM